MLYIEYLKGIEFIRKNSGTQEEENQRIAYWEMFAKPLIVD